MFVPNVNVISPVARHNDHFIDADFEYNRAICSFEQNGTANVERIVERYSFRTKKHVGRVGLLMVGWGGNNGSTITAAIAANKDAITWNTKDGCSHPNYHGSVLLSSTVRVGSTADHEDVFAPMNALLPMVHPNDLVIGGWDVCADDLAVAIQGAKVLDYDLQRKLLPIMSKCKPLPGVYYTGFAADNQKDRASNIIPGNDKWKHLEQLRKDIRDFKTNNNLDTVVVVWTASTERFVQELPGVNDTADNLMKAIEGSHPEISPSTLYAVAAILEGAPYINGSPQNTFVPGCVKLAENLNVFIGGDDFKSGQTKFKSALVDFLVNAGIRPTSIVSYNHLGNNDGRNLSAAAQFRSKEISKRNVVDDLVDSNGILYRRAEDHPDHVVVIKYVPSVGDSKRAMDEYVSDIFMGGKNTIVTHNTCEDSLLAAPLILDLVILTELFTRIKYRTASTKQYASFHPVLSALSYMLKAPMVPNGMPVVNSLFRQRACIENLLKICSGLPPEDDLRLEHRAVPSNKLRANIPNGRIRTTSAQSILDGDTMANGHILPNGVHNGHPH